MRKTTELERWAALATGEVWHGGACAARFAAVLAARGRAPAMIRRFGVIGPSAIGRPRYIGFAMDSPLMPNPLPDAEFFRALEVRRIAALLARDMPVIERLHAPDYELISPPGRVMTFERYRSLLAAGPFYAGWTHGEMRVRAARDMAAIRYQARISFPSGKVFDCWHTDIYVLLQGSWRAAWSQATQLPDSP